MIESLTFDSTLDDYRDESAVARLQESAEGRALLRLHAYIITNDPDADGDTREVPPFHNSAADQCAALYEELNALGLEVP